MNYGLIGEKLSHSYSPQIHGYFGNDDYILKEIAKEDLHSFMTERNFKGINVTIPYKQEVMKYCELSPEAEKIGSVNTIVNRDGKLFGYNTDYLGFSLSAKLKGISFEDKKVLILGSGGTSKTVCAVAEAEGAKEIITVSRNGRDNYSNISSHFDADIIINTTPVGMYPKNHASPMNLSPFQNLSGVIDVVYNPLRTNLILQSIELGIPCTGGLPMLVGQAMFAHNIFFGLSDTSLIDSTLKECEKLFRNIVFIGMPGAGKSSKAKAISEKYSLRFLDTDDEIKRFSGKSPSQIITEEGEPHFREIEARVIADISRRTGYVIATGGGAVLKEENRRALKQNGTIIYLTRDLESLSTKDRPLSVDLESLYKVRNPIYTALADHMVTVEEDPEDTLKNIEVYI